MTELGQLKKKKKIDVKENMTFASQSCLDQTAFAPHVLNLSFGFLSPLDPTYIPIIDHFTVTFCMYDLYNLN